MPGVELNRSFIDITDSHQEPDVRMMASILQQLDRALNWTGVLQHKYAVILGEALSGKTWEFRRQTERINSNGGDAFFFLLRSLANGDYEVALSGPEEGEKLEKWKSSNGEAYFFLDSLDETKIAGKSLDLALRHFENRLGASINRARVYISSRFSDWRPNADLEILNEFIEKVDKKSDGIENDQHQNGNREFTARVFHLGWLNNEQIRTVAEFETKRDATGFAAAVYREGVSELVARPGDVRWAVRFWTEKGRFGRYSEIIEHNIQQRLQERRELVESLSPQECQAAVEDLALFATMTGSFSFQVPDHGSFAGEIGQPVNASDILQSWNNEKIGRLLRLAIFDVATYGQVKFHVRPVQEYLAAMSLKAKFSDGVGQKEIERLFFVQSFGATVVPRHLHETAAWLAIKIDWFREQLADIAPEILIDLGDPSSLPIDTKRKLLRKWNLKMRERPYQWQWFGVHSLRRFASEELVPEINEMLLSEETHHLAKRTLLSLADDGGLQGAVKSCLALLKNRREREMLGDLACDAVCANGSRSEKRELVETVLGFQNVQYAISNSVAKRLFPEVLKREELVEVIKKTRPFPDENTTTYFELFLENQLPEKCDVETAKFILREFVFKAKADAGTNERWRLCQEATRWTERIVTGLLVKLLENTENTEEIENALIAFRNEDTHVSSRRQALFKRVAEALKANAGCRRALFWRNVAQVPESERSGPPYYRNLNYPFRIFHLDEWDTDWLLEDAARKEKRLDRLVAFELALCFLGRVKNLKADPRVEELRRQHVELDARFMRFTNPKPSNSFMKTPSQRKIEMYERRDKAKREAMKSRTAEIEKAADEEALQELYIYCLQRVIKTQLGISNLRPVIEEYGEETANAVKEGAKRFWRKHPVQKLTCGSVGLALTGLLFEFLGGLDFASMPEPDVAIATELALEEKNEFPPWFENLLETRPGIVKPLVSRSLEEEFTKPEESRPRRPNIEKVRKASSTVRSVFEEQIFNLLKTSAPLSTETLQNVLGILVDSVEVDCEDLSARIIVLANEFRHSRDSFVPLWCVLFCVRPSHAIEMWESINSTTSDDEIDDLKHEICKFLSFWSNGLWPTEFPRNDAKQLGFLIAGLHPDDKSTNDDYYARHFLNDVEKWLWNTNSETTVAVFRELSEKPLFQHRKYEFLRSAETKAREVGSCRPFSMAQVRDWLGKKSFEPLLPGQLFRIAKWRIEEAKAAIEKNRFSLRNELREGDEAGFQRWLANALETNSHGHFSVVREEEVDQRKKPDIRLHSTSFMSPIGIEMKIADNWTGPKLAERLRNQLVGQYLSTHDAFYALFVVAFFGRGKERWQIKRGHNLDFSELVDELRAIASDIAKGNPEVYGLEVIGINFRDPKKG
ncbi:MAG: hypothetical protein P9L99_06275 [Candidatus Lernaella stagnicola]|nr:hypothetical protein [Candidatus Lernaella stagnicola]